MTTIQVYDKPMCCSSGVCGPQVDPVLTRFAADLNWLSTQGRDVQRFNLAQQPGEFAENATVREILAAEGTSGLPVIVVNDVVMSRGTYPSRQTLEGWTQRDEAQALPVWGQSGGCCGGTNCC